MNRSYEAMLILDPRLDDEGHKKIVERVHDAISKQGGEIEKTDTIGRKRMSFRIQKQPDGYYVLTHFKSKPESINELNRVCRITDGLMRHLIIKHDE